VEARAQRVLAARTGMGVHVADASVGLRSATLRSVELTGRHGGVRVHLGEATATAGWGALLTGRVSIDRVEARDVQVEVDLADEGTGPSLTAMREALRGGAASEQDPGARDGASDRRVSVEGLRVDVRSGSARRLSVRGGAARLEGDALRLKAVEAHLQSSAGHRADLSEPVVEARRTGEGWILTGFSTARGQIALQQFASDAKGSPEGAGADDGEDGEPAEPVVAPGETGWAERLGELVDRLAPDTDIRAADLTILSVSGGEETPILEGLEVVIRGRGDGVFHSSGGGRAAEQGRLDWEMTLRPREAKAEGTLRLHRLPLALAAPLLPGLPWHEPERADLDGELEVRAESPSRMAVRGRVSVTGAALGSARIAPEPVRDISFTVEGQGVWIPQQRRLRLESGSVRSGGARLELDGTFEWSGGHYLTAATVALPPTHCNEAVSALPADLLGETAEFSWQGELAGKIVVHVDSRNLDDTKLEIRLADGCQFQRVARVADLERFRGVFVHQVREPDDSVFEMSTGPGSGNWQPVRSISPFLVHAVLAHEDASFFRHQGFAPWAIEEALERNLKAGRYVVGASTITMQLAKNLFLRREKTLARKVQEVLLTWWLERGLGKRDILELYLNVIEYGPGVYGIRNAAWHYFGRTPAELSAAEGAYLATILPNPKRHADEFEKGTLRASTAAKMRRLLRHMAAKNRIDEEALAFAMSEVESFRFRGPDGAAAEPREAPGEAGPLPMGIADEAEGSGWSGWDTMFDGQEVRGVSADDLYGNLPEVDPDDVFWD
jgi:hypothetical protein